MSTRSRGAYAVNKTKKYFENLGYQVVKSEISKMIWMGGRSIIGHTDMWGSDLICMNKDDIIFVQVKTNKVHISPAKHEFDKYIWPPFVKRYIMRWEPRAKEPIIIDYKV